MKARLLAMSVLGAASLIGSALPAMADGADAAKSHWSGSVSLTSDYRFRGVSQTDRNAALQGGLQYTGSSGLYVGAWASNVDFPGASSEVDVYAGYDYGLDENTTIGAQLIAYMYPNSDDSELNYYEVIAKASHQMGSIGLSLEVDYAPDLDGQNALAISGGVEAQVIDSVYLFNDGISASGHFGHQSFDETGGDYNFYDVGLTASAGVFALDVRYVGTDLNEADCGATDRCEGGVVVTGSLSFGD
ncbi:MAG: TorF family putative porin [Micropepsaceae bacterium]